jgi:hypothetical protein
MNIENNGSYSLELPNEITTEAKIKITVLDFYGNSGEGISDNFSIIVEPIYGCIDELACNYDSLSNTDDGNCTYSEENFDCEGNCTAELDCAGTCAGVSTIDECGVCDGLGADFECWDSQIVCGENECIPQPLYFTFETDILTLDGIAPIVEWISPNNGGILPSGDVIQAEWNATDDSLNETPVHLDINDNGNLVSTLSNQSASGIHDILLPEIISENISFKITATDNFGNSSIDESDNLFTLKKFGCTDETANNYNENAELDDNSCYYSTTLSMGSGNNLISLPGLLFDNSTQTFIEAIEEQCGNNIYFILGQGVGLFNTENG